jgi:DUF2075 family protein/DNA replication protein DnaC
MREIQTHTSAKQPEGSPFFIDRCAFVPGQQIDTSVLELEEDKVLNRPMVYILANDDEAYVGQTTSVAHRIAQHGENREKKDFKTVNIIYNDEFNSSIITDYEHRLIQLMHGDGRYRLTNKNDGMTDTNYFSKEEYSKMFEELWEDLRQIELANKSIQEIEESEVFKYSPFKGLTADQRVALDDILNAIESGLDNAKPILIQGMPGTGKTILAIYLLKMLKDDPKYADMNIKLMEPVTSLRNTLRSSLKGVYSLDKSDIIAPSDLDKPKMGYVSGKKHNFDIVLVDETHKLKRRVNLGTQFGNFDKVNKELSLDKESTQLDWIIDQVKLPIFFYDPLQTVGPSCVTRKQIRSALGSAMDNPITLDSQMRVKGGKEYLDYIQAILNGEDPTPRKFDGYDLVLHEDIRTFVDSFEKTFEEHSLSRMIAGYAWKWVSKADLHPDMDSDDRPYDIEFDELGDHGLRWNCTYDNWVGKGFDNPVIAHEVGCIHSIQGYDLSYAYVLIGNDLELDPKTGLLRANRKSYFDRNGSVTANEEELTQYIKNIYYVLLTRGIYGTHIYVCNDELRKFMSRYFVCE